VDAVVDHEAGLARSEVRGVGGERAPDRRSGARRIVGSLPLERRAAPFEHVDAEMLPIPLAERLRILRLEEDPADSDDTLHSIPFPGHWKSLSPPECSMT